MKLGAGRERLIDELDYGAGITIEKNIGDYINKGNTLMTLYTNKEIDIEKISSSIFLIEQEKNDNIKLIYEIMK